MGSFAGGAEAERKQCSCHQNPAASTGTVQWKQRWFQPISEHLTDLPIGKIEEKIILSVIDFPEISYRDINKIIFHSIITSQVCSLGRSLKTLVPNEKKNVNNDHN